MIFTLWIGHKYNESSKNEAVRLSSQVNDLNSNVIQLIPQNPDISIVAIKEEKSNTMENVVYRCQTYDPFFDSDTSYPSYDIIRIFIQNNGRETKGLKIDFDECIKNTKIFKICSELGQDTNFLMKNGPYKMIEIQKIEKINPHVITLIYAYESPNGCNISYSSEDIIYNKTYVDFG